MSRPNYKPQHHYTEAEYLDFEQHSETKHEYFDGEIFAMAGASKSHQRIISNLVINIGAHLKNTDIHNLNPLFAPVVNA